MGMGIRIYVEGDRVSNKTSVPMSKERLTVDRLNALSDGVLAIVMTLLVLSIDIPTDHNFTVDGLVKFIKKLEPSLIAYVSSFVMVGIYWIQHHVVFQFLRYVNRRLILLNILFLLPITLLPFVAKMKALYRHERQVIVLFAFAHILCGLLLLALWGYAVSHTELLVKQINPQVRHSMTLRILTLPFFCLASIGLAFVDVNLGTYIFLVVPLFYFSNSVVDTFIEAPEQQSRL
jgi:uncharacterized membrane protein